MVLHSRSLYLFRLQIRNTKVEQASKPKRAPASEASIISTILFGLFFGGSSNGVPRTTPKTKEVGACAVDVRFTLDVTVVSAVASIVVSAVVLVVSAVVPTTEVVGNRVLFSNAGFEVGLMSVTAKTIKHAEVITLRFLISYMTVTTQMNITYDFYEKFYLGQRI